MSKWKSVGIRFLKAFVAGFVTSCGVITAANIQVWGDLALALQAILLAGTIGGINGVIMGAEKWWNWVDDPSQL